MLLRNFLTVVLLSLALKALCQPQDVEFHLTGQLFPGTKILKVKSDFYDPYVWVLAQNNQVYRVNSVNLAVVNYSNQFAAYNSLQFIDIAGRSKDTVFIATNSTNIIHYKNGAIKLIGTADGIPDTVNSIGIAGGGFPFVTRNRPPILMIATRKGFSLYNTTTEKIAYKDNGDSKVYDATYRTELYKDSSASSSNFITLDTVQFQPVRFFPDDGAEYNGYLWENANEFGTQINTATTVYEATYDVDGVFSNLFWGTDRGLFQNNFNNSYNVFGPTPNYMPGIKINKLTNIYGLTAFGSGAPNDISPFIKQNLLIGTDTGFYFSSSVYVPASGFDIIRNFSIFHDDELGAKVINDICVIASSINVPICENAVWLGANDGLYLLKPDYGAFLGNQQVNAAGFANQPASLTNLNLCAGYTATAVVNKGTYTGSSLQWYKNGSEMPGASTDSLKITTAGDYYAVLYDPCEGISLQSNHLTVNVISSPVFSFNYPAKIQHCNSSPDALQTTYNPGYHYQWYTNGVLNGDTTNAYIVTQSGKYKVEVSACTNSWVPSKEVEVDVINLPVPQVTADKAVYCAEDTAKLSVNAPVDPSYHINWYQDGNLLAAKTDSASIKVTSGGNYTATLTSTVGPCTQTSTPIAVAFTPAPVFTFNYPDQLQYCTGTPLTLTATGSSGYQYRWYKNDTLNNVTNESLAITQNGKYKVEVSSCAGSWVASKEVQVTFITVAVPVIATDKKNYCIGDNAVLSLAATYDPDFNIQWYNNNVMVPNSTGQPSITINQPGNYTVSLVNGSVNTDGSTCIQTSAVQPITFDPPPAVSIQQTVNTTLCAGQTVTLNAKYSSGTVQWSTGETADQITVTQTGKYKVTVTSPAGCQADTSINVTFLPDPVFSLRDTSICTYKKQVVTLTAPPGFAAYSWNNGASTAETYAVTQPQTVSLTVTDANGCQATQQIKVADECPMVVIPNAFTPNGDGINDTWVIEGLDETGTVKVFTRWGAEVYQSVGYSTPWNGEYAGKKLSPGVYYYIVTAKSGTQKFSGSLTIIY